MSTENTTRDMDLDDPFINDYATKVADTEEVLMRADFARMCEVHNNMPHAETKKEFDQLADQADEIHRRWSGHPTELGTAWHYLTLAHDDWKRAPDTMRRFHDQIAHDRANSWDPPTPIEWRSQQQARELTGHGSWSVPTFEAGPAPVPGHAFANVPGHAFAAGTEREGMDR